LEFGRNLFVQIAEPRQGMSLRKKDRKHSKDDTRGARKEGIVVETPEGKWRSRQEVKTNVILKAEKRKSAKALGDD